jgi:ribonuclease P/MRP protein subunit POP5
MTTRPPTLREKRRYILVRAEPAGTLVDPKDLYFALSDAVTSLWGDAVAAVIMQAVVAAEGPYAVIRCRRGTERELAIACSTVTGSREGRMALRLVAASGTIETLRERIRAEKPAEPRREEPADLVIGGKPYALVQADGQKIDVIEKGFKNTHRLYLTREDLEEY